MPASNASRWTPSAARSWRAPGQHGDDTSVIATMIATTARRPPKPGSGAGKQTWPRRLQAATASRPQHLLGQVRHRPGQPPSAIVQSWDTLKLDPRPLGIAKHRRKASELVDKVNFDVVPPKPAPRCQTWWRPAP